LDVSLSSSSRASDALYSADPNGKGLSVQSSSQFQSPSIQAGGFIWNVHTIGLNDYARIRLYKLDTSVAVTTPLLVFTPKTIKENEHLFNASFATSSGDPNAPAFITATRTIPSSSTNGRATTVMFAGLNSSSKDTDWSVVSRGQSPAQFATINCLCARGNYSSTQIDPSNPKRAWGFSQLATNETDWTVTAGEVARSPQFSLR
jgi:hypothetical protein